MATCLDDPGAHGDRLHGDGALRHAGHLDVEDVAQLCPAGEAIRETAERLNVSEVATTDRRHFGAVRPAHAEAFQLLP
jgi:hypothetical protein